MDGARLNMAGASTVGAPMKPLFSSAEDLKSGASFSTDIWNPQSQGGMWQAPHSAPFSSEL